MKAFPCLFLILVIAAGFLAGCETLDSGSGPGAASPEVLRVGVTANAPPMIDRQGSQYYGLEADLARALAPELGRSVRFTHMKWEALIPALQSGSIDIIMSGMSVTQERSVLVAFAEPYLAVGQMLLVRNADSFTFEYPEIITALKRNIGVEKGTTADVFVQRFCRNATRVPTSPDQAVSALNRGRIDVFIHDAPVIWKLAAQNAATGVVAIRRPLREEYLAWAVRRGDNVLLSSVNESLAKWKKDGRLDAMVRRWIPLP